jgi:hypothetical protein
MRSYKPSAAPTSRIFAMTNPYCDALLIIEHLLTRLILFVTAARWPATDDGERVETFVGSAAQR